MEFNKNIRSLYQLVYRGEFPGNDHACYKLQEHVKALCINNNKTDIMILAINMGFRFNKNLALYQICDHAKNFLARSCEQAKEYDDLPYEEQFKRTFGITPKPDIDIKAYLKESNQNFSFLTILAVRDQWPAMLKIALTYEKLWPPAAPHMFYTIHNCNDRELQVAEIIANAYDKAVELRNRELISILDDRISKGVLIYPCCDRGDRDCIKEINEPLKI